MNFKGAIFDMDGTILDSMKLWEEIDIEFLSKRGYGVPEDYMRSIAHMGAMDAALLTQSSWFNLTDTPGGAHRRVADIGALKNTIRSRKGSVRNTFPTFTKTA